MNQQCTYIHELPSGEEWSCGHPSTDGRELCLFHLPVDETDDAAVRDAFVDAVLNGETNGAEPNGGFVGAQFGRLELPAGLELDTAGGAIDLREASFDAFVADDTVVTPRIRFERGHCDGLFSTDGATLEGGLDATEATFAGETVLARTTFDGPLTLIEAVVRGDLRIRESRLSRFVASDATFSGWVKGFGLAVDGVTMLNSVTFEQRALFSRATFGDEVNLWGEATFEHDAAFTQATFEGILDLHGENLGQTTRFEQKALFGGATFKDRVDFQSVAFQGPARFSPQQVSQPTRFERAAQFENTRFEQGAVFKGVTFEQYASFSEGSEFGGDLDLRESRHGILDVGPISLDDDVLVDLSGASIEECRITAREAVGFDLVSATVESLEVSTDGPNPIDAIRFLETRLGQFDFYAHLDELEATDWSLHRLDADVTGEETPTPRQLKATYQHAKSSANDAGDGNAAGVFFRKEMYYRRRHLAKRARTHPELSSRLRAAADWTANAALGASSGYGEEPKLTVYSSMAVIVGFSGLYALAQPAAEVEPLRHLLFSFQSFITFVVGPPGTDTATFSIQLLSAIEGFLGAFLVALFVFTLTSSIDR